MEKKPQSDFRNVAVPRAEHQLLRELAKVERRSMAQQMAVLIRDGHDNIEKEDTT